MKALVRKSDLINGQMKSGCNVNLYDVNENLVDCFNLHLVTEGGFYSKKSFFVNLPTDAVLNNDTNRFEFSEESYNDLKAIYGVDCIVFGKSTPSQTVRNLAMCNYMNDPYDRG